MRRPVMLMFPLLLLAATAAAQTSSCSADEFRHFDFWLGHWQVEDAGGKVLGNNTISRIADGCGLREEWVGQGGGTGTSLNYYDPADERWHQHWVGGTGLILHLTGGLEGASMVMVGRDRSGRDGNQVRDRITWTPGEDGRVRQFWDVSQDGGETWQGVFEGFYVRAD